MANRRWTSQFLYQYEAMPVLVSCNFVVDAANGNGLGIRSLKGNGVQNVFMHTSTTPGRGNAPIGTSGLVGPLNPNPGNGVILVQLTDNFNRYLSGFNGRVSPVTSTQTTTTSHVAYVITSLGSATLAQWQTAGLPLGLTPTVGQAFIAIATGTIGGSATVAPTATAGSGVDHIEVLGDPNTTLSVAQSAINGGGLIVLECFAASVVTAPADTTVIGLNFYLSNSSVTVNGQ